MCLIKLSSSRVPFVEDGVDHSRLWDGGQRISKDCLEVTCLGVFPFRGLIEAHSGKQSTFVVFSRFQIGAASSRGFCNSNRYGHFLCCIITTFREYNMPAIINCYGLCASCCIHRKAGSIPNPHSVYSTVIMLWAAVTAALTC